MPQHSTEVQTTPSLVCQETKDMQTSTAIASQNSIPHSESSPSVIVDSVLDNNMLQNLNVARFISSQQALGSQDISVNRNGLGAIKTSTQKVVLSQEPLFSDSLPSSVSQNGSCRPASIKVDQNESQNITRNLFLNVEEPMETEDEEVTVIEKTQEENTKLFESINVKGGTDKNKFKDIINNKVSDELETSHMFTINSDDILQATLSQPMKSTIFAKNKEECLFESPAKVSKTSTPMSRNESDYNDSDDFVLNRSHTRSRKRGRAVIISSDSESEIEVKPTKRPTRLSIKKNITAKLLPQKESGTSSLADSDAPIRALVRSDLAYARAVAAQGSSTEESINTINLDSTPRTTEVSPR